MRRTIYALLMLLLLTVSVALAQARTDKPVAATLSEITMVNSYKFVVADTSFYATLDVDGTITFSLPDAEAARKLLDLLKQSLNREHDLEVALRTAMPFVYLAESLGRTMSPPQAKGGAAALRQLRATVATAKLEIESLTKRKDRQ